ncbi:MAG: 50S ribosomal protein L11 methyltransferase [Pseudomonadota bacterium]
MREEEEGYFGKAFIGNWVEDKTSFLFFSQPSSGLISSLLENRSDLELIDEYRFTYEQWQGGGLKPIKVENILITPPWEKSDRAEGEIRIILDPGVVFGTGLHPSTRDCIRALTCLRKETLFENVLDLGTGTGVLALVAMRLGAKRVLAVDLNPLCVKTARKNIAYNRLEDGIRVECGRAEDFIHEPADLLAANIHYGAMSSLSQLVLSKMKVTPPVCCGINECLSGI